MSFDSAYGPNDYKQQDEPVGFHFSPTQAAYSKAAEA